MPETTIYCSSQVKDSWPRPLAARWAADYPQLFDEDDVRVTVKQSPNHFCEWFAAIHLFQRDGVQALVEKYLFRTHSRKQKWLRDHLSADDIQALRDISRSVGAQLPDLLLHKSGRLVGFAEAKGPNDRLSAKQRVTHVKLQRHFGVPTEVLNIRLIG